MRLSTVLGFVAATLIALTMWGVSELPSENGDVAGVEAVLAPDADPESQSPSVSTIDDPPQARWNANNTSLLAEVTASERPIPVRLTIDRIDVSAPIGSYGIDSEGLMDVPDNITDVGWYKFGPSPGEPGSSVLAAHVDLAGPGRGVFFDLDELVEGDQLGVSFSDGSSERFVVVARATYSKDELPLDVIFSQEGDPVLTLITCGGSFSRSERSYDSNVVVYAVPVTSNDASPEIEIFN